MWLHVHGKQFIFVAKLSYIHFTLNMWIGNTKTLKALRTCDAREKKIFAPNNVVATCSQPYLLSYT